MSHTPITLLPAAPPRPIDAHKGDFGTVVVVGGSAMMIGAPALAATAALRIGAGLVKIAADAAWIGHCLTIEPSATGLAIPAIGDATAVGELLMRWDESTVLAVGPGFGVGLEQQGWVSQILGGCNPVVLDADGLNNLAAIGGKFSARHAPLIVTPHPGEFARLAAPLGITLSPTLPAQRSEAAVALAKALGAVVVLKGHRSIVTDGHRLYVNQTGNPALATANNDDMLTGAIAGLIAQGLAPLYASILGVYLHGKAADLWAAQYGPAGLTARDLAALLPEALHQHRTATP